MISKKSTGVMLMGFAYPTMTLLGLVIYVWTIVIAFDVSGIISAVISVLTPVVAQMFWFVKVWGITGTPLNWYCLAIFAYIICWVVLVFGQRMMELEKV